ncbi:periplasmic chaperone for outer membrane proteins SurA [Methylobacillus rhizosphaerae]|uniref:Chaperone SurA n=1 Tax=Methylobacillus rhizosphaerae TaxID=551994 RepID=A0A238Y382_9PROT|nr:peptidylprolyl isomerase [Methylobacillus rhizosphaerae]SNR65432.1 periplasmic chaperone for outer membrane proteins SurA [Methylobacillus rhizosphaerae]
MLNHFLNSLAKQGLIAFLLLISMPSIAADIVKMDRIVAVVDQGIITEKELADRIETVTAQLEKQGTQLPPRDVLEKQILERLINDKLQLQFAAQTGLRVDDAQLDKTIERIAEQNNLSTGEFRKALEAEGIPYRKFREDIRNEIILARLREREVDNRMNVTESEIDNYLTTQSSRTDAQQDEFEVAHILVRAPEEGSPQELQKLKAKAETALKALQDGADFAQISAGYSDAPNALEGGVLGWKTPAQLPSLFTEALQSLQPGQISSVLRSPNGYHILKLLNRRGGNSPLVVDQTHVRHILIKLSEIISEQEAQQKINSIKQRLDHGADFAELARQYSEDASANNGGDLGWTNPGDTVPQFEQVMNALPIDQISDPVRSPFGWHIIQVLERRQQDMSKESARLKARQEIRARKADEGYQDWISELRDRAYVEYRLEDKY